VVVSTNLAESSVTIDGIVYVIDCCFVKTKYYDYMKGDESLVVTPISKASANQRAGRAGRVKAGECYRLCPKNDFEQFYDESSPEICRANLANIFLQMKALGIGNLAKFEFITTPTEESFVR
jgi:ATP-dependent RNA helicase DDX35